METILTVNPVYRAYHYLNYDLQDVRTQHLPLIDRPFTVIVILIIYNFVCLKYGPQFMAKRNPFDIKKAIIAFDIFQIISNVYLCYQALDLGWLHHNRFLCAEIDYEDTPRLRGYSLACYLYFLLKLTDMFDTIFMVLRKKNEHISFLHMYHHSTMIFTTWVTAKYLPTGHHTLLGMYNTAVHAIMYTYYLVAALFPNNNLILIKKLVTKLQMIQFIVIGLHMSTLAFARNCNYPSWPLHFILPQIVIILALFYDFYMKTYTKKKAQLKQT